MSYEYQVGKHYRVKAEKVYPWPREPLPDRTVQLFPDDILTAHENGSMTKHTGLMMMNIRVPFDDLIECEGPPSLFVQSGLV